MPSPGAEDTYWNPDLGPAPFKRIDSGPLTCRICKGVFSTNFGWGCDGWMCAKWSCKTCEAVHLVVDSIEFCNACEFRSVTCISHPILFIRSKNV